MRIRGWDWSESGYIGVGLEKTAQTASTLRVRVKARVRFRARIRIRARAVIFSMQGAGRKGTCDLTTLIFEP